MESFRINWEDARYLLAVSRSGQLGKAANSLGVSVMTLSRHLNQLQMRLNSVLVVRHSKGMKLTDEGGRLVEYLERAEAEIEAAGSIFNQNAKSVSGTVRISAPEGFALKVLTSNLNRLLLAHPDLAIEVVPQTLGFSLSRREADLAVMVGRPTEACLRFESLGTYALGLYASATYIESHGHPRSPDELSSHRLIGYVEDLLFSDRLNIARAVWPGWRSRVSIYSPVGQVEAVRSGLGIGVLHRFLLCEEDMLIPVLPELQLTREFFLVSHPSNERIPRIRVAHEFLRSLSGALK